MLVSPTSIAYDVPGTTVMLFLYANEPPLPPYAPPVPPAPIQTTHTDVTPAGAVHV